MKTNHAPKTTEKKRSYKQGARAEATARTAETIVEVFAGFLETGWYNDISLERIAAAANVTVPTILRHFGSKEGILEAITVKFGDEILSRRTVEPGDIDRAIAVIVEDYEITGDVVVRFLAQEDQIPAIRAITDFGRASHRRWCRQTFAPYFDGLAPDRQEWLNDSLVVALDLYTWKLWRRDRGRSAEDVRVFMKTLVLGMIGPVNGAV
jgi:AcrR family transcriptional regulator